MYIDTLRQHGYYALAAYCKMRDHFNSVPLFEDHLTPVQNRWIVISGLPGDTSLIRDLCDQFVGQGYARHTLKIMNEIAKREIVRALKPGFYNTFHYKRAMLRGGQYARNPELRLWFENIANKNQDNHWGKDAQHVIAFIDSKLARQEE